MKISLKLIICLIYILLFQFEGFANFQTIRFKHLTENIALKQSNVNHIFQDSLGFIYFGTNEGLFMYDGFKVKLFWNNSNEGTVLSNNNILSGCELTSNSLLLSTTNGLVVFDKDLERFTSLKVDSEYDFGDISLIKTKNSTFMISSEGFGEIRVFTTDDQYGMEYLSMNHLFSDFITEDQFLINCFSVSDDGNLMLGFYNNRILRYQIETKRISEINLQNRKLFSLYEDDNGYLWAGTRDNILYRYNLKTSVNDTFHLNTNRNSYEHVKYISSICEDSNGNIIVGSNNNGLCIIQSNQRYKEDPELEYFSSDPNNPNTPCDNNITFLYHDRSDAIFVGTKGNGVNEVNLGQSCFTQHIVDEYNDNSLDHIRVNAIYDDSYGNTWFGTRLGLNRYEKKSKQYYQYHDRLLKGHKIVPKGIESIGEVTCFCRDDKGDLWMGTYGTGLYKYSYRDDTFINYKDSFNFDVPADRITDITKDNNGNLWISSHGNGIAKIVHEDTTAHKIEVQYFNCNEDSPIGYQKQNVDIVFQDVKNYLWFSDRERGLFRFNPQSGKMKQFGSIPGDTTSISNNSIISICADLHDDLWIGTARGLNKFDIENEIFTSYTMESGLPHNSICGVLSDDSGKIWLYTQRGIYRFDPETQQFDSYIENTRIFHENNTIDATFKTENGKLFFGTLNNGCIEFHPDSIKANPFLPPTIITDFRISNRSIKPGEMIGGRVILTKPVNNMELIELNYSQNDLAIEFTALSYNREVKAEFAYKMQGFDNGWIHTEDKQKLVPYSNLSPGLYTFKIKAMNPESVITSRESTLKIIINPPFWATSIAYSLYVLLFVLIAFLLYRYTISRIRLQNDLRIERMKLGFFTNISHEFRTPLTLISGPLQKLIRTEETMNQDEKKDYYTLMRRNTDKLMKLVDQILDVRKIDNNKMTLMAEETDVVAFAKDIFNSFTAIARERDIDFSFHSVEHKISLWCDQDKLEKILYNLLSNAFKYTPEGKISLMIQFSNGNKNVEISVKDSGIGIPQDQIKNVFNRFYRVDNPEASAINGTGLGLSIVKNFVEMHRGKVTVTNNCDSGCTFTIMLPCGDKHLYESEKKEFASERETIVDRAQEMNTLMLDDRSLNSELEDGSNKSMPVVLVVEDNAEVRFFIERNLKATYKIITAENGQQGLEKAVEHFPDLVISDVMMPNMDGLEFCEKLKKDIRICHIPVILLTARSSTDHQIEGIETGADAYITKPFEIDYLEARVKNLINSRIRLRKIYTSSSEPIVPETSSNSLDKEFIEKAVEIVEKNLENPDFSVPKFTSEMGMSNSVLFRKLKALTGLSASEFIKNIRLKKAAALIVSQKYTVTEVATLVGFNDPKYFSTCFKKMYDKSPKQYGRTPDSM